MNKNICRIFIFIRFAFLSIGIGTKSSSVLSETKNKTILFAEDVNEAGNHWRLILTKIENLVKVEPRLIHCDDCTELSLPLTLFCPIAKFNDEKELIKQIGHVDDRELKFYRKFGKEYRSQAEEFWNFTPPISQCNSSC